MFLTSPLLEQAIAQVCAVCSPLSRDACAMAIFQQCSRSWRQSKELSGANYAFEGRVAAADLCIRTIAPPTTIATGSAHDHSIQATSIGRCAATHTAAAPINVQKT